LIPIDARLHEILGRLRQGIDFVCWLRTPYHYIKRFSCCCVGRF